MTFRFQVRVPRRVNLQAGSRDEVTRAEFFEWCWSEFVDQGLCGVDEGTVLSESAAEMGLETESWTIDSGEAPRERDWVGGQALEESWLYFTERAGAESARARLIEATKLGAGSVEEQAPQDWDAEWKASYKGIDLPPFWEIRPPWDGVLPPNPGKVRLLINPGAGFGTGTHETTQLCLQVMGELVENHRLVLEEATVLDFGSGSGILSIGAALLGAQRVDAVEIDPLANDNARDNAMLNGVQERVRVQEVLPQRGQPYRLVFANILRPVLVEFCDRICDRVESPEGATRATLILSGLVEEDLARVNAAYARRLGRPADQSFSKNEWRALLWLGHSPKM